MRKKRPGQALSVKEGQGKGPFVKRPGQPDKMRAKGPCVKEGQKKRDKGKGAFMKKAKSRLLCKRKPYLR